MIVSLDKLTYRSAFFDPASSKTPIKSVRARQAIVVVGMDDLMRIFVLYAWAGRLTVAKLYDKVLDVNRDWKPRAFGVEANAMQAFVGEAIALEAKRRDEKLPFVPVYQPTKVEKDFRIRTILQPIIGWGRLFLHPSQHELRNEIATFPMNVLKDLVDALASAIALLPVRSSAKRRTVHRDAHLKYLQEIGASPAYIQQRLNDIRYGRFTTSLDKDEESTYISTP